jgi:hypothetical protein
MAVSLTITLLCPTCAAVIDMHSHRDGVCTRCFADVTVNPTYSNVKFNRDAPFASLVMLCDKPPPLPTEKPSLPAGTPEGRSVSVT